MLFRNRRRRLVVIEAMLLAGQDSFPNRGSDFFYHNVQVGCGTLAAVHSMGVGRLCEGVNRPWREAVHLHVVERSGMPKAVPLLPHMLYGVASNLLDRGTIVVSRVT